MSIKYAILGLLNYSDMHGYRIKEHIEKNFDYMWAVNFGQIYPNLKDLEEEGFIHMFGVIALAC
jgi:PadR family transcriptional regulator AphA